MNDPYGYGDPYRRGCPECWQERNDDAPLPDAGDPTWVLCQHHKDELKDMFFDAYDLYEDDWWRDFEGCK